MSASYRDNIANGSILLGQGARRECVRGSSVTRFALPAWFSNNWPAPALGRPVPWPCWYWMVGKDRRRNVQQSQHARLPAGLVVQHMHTKARRRFSELIADGDLGSS